MHLFLDTNVLLSFFHYAGDDLEELKKLIVLLAKGNLHYFWDLERGSPYVITSFPTPESVTGYQKVTPNPTRLIEDHVDDDYIVLTQRPSYQSEAAWRNEAERPGYIAANKLRFLRPYQKKAIHALQVSVKDGKDRFLFEMATGTGKTLTAAAIIKLFLRTGNARRILFLVDRLELEDQAKKAFTAALANDYKTVKPIGEGEGGGEGPVVTGGVYEHLGEDIILDLKEEIIGQSGMKIDRMFFEKFEDTVRENATIAAAVEAGQWDRVIDYVNREVFDKPEEFYTLDKLRKAAAVDRRLTLREILEKIFGLIPRFKSKDELLEEEFAKFVADYKPAEPGAMPALKNFFKAYAASDQIRTIIDTRHFTDLATNPVFSTRDLKAVPAKYRTGSPMNT